MKRILLVVISFLTISMTGLSPHVPVTGTTNPGKVLSTAACENPTSFLLGIQRSSLHAKRINTIVVEDHFSFNVVEQPLNNSGYVSNEKNTVTRFRTADNYGSTGFLAHNYLAGAEFLSLKVGDRIDLTIENEVGQSFWVFSIRKFQALSPCSTTSDFVDLKNGQGYSASELFMDFYGQDDLIVLQTCLEKDGIKSWGRIFIMAYPVSAVFYKPWPTENDSYLQDGFPFPQ